MATAKLGELLIQQGVINDEMLHYALNVQKSSGERLGEILFKLCFVTDHELAKAIALQADMEYEDLINFRADSEALHLLPLNFSRHYDVLPLMEKDNELILAIHDPFDNEVISHLHRFVKQAVKIVVSPKKRLREYIQKFYYLVEHPLDQRIGEINQLAREQQSFLTEELVDLLISYGIYMQASDIHISATPFASLVSYRIDGVLQLFYSFPLDIHSRIISNVKVRADIDIATINQAQDGRMSFEFLQQQYDLRVATSPFVDGEKLVIRLLTVGELISLAETGLTVNQCSILEHLIAQPYGIILVCGPTGSGKSTTLYAMVRKINAMQKNIVTIEDPIEYKMPMVNQMAVNEKADLTFAKATRGFLRQDPDIILIGEIRDEDTASLAMRASQTGHLVFSTVHSNNAAGAVARLRDLGVKNAMLSASIIGFVAQRLVRKLCHFCKQAYKISEEEQRRLGIKSDKLYQHQGCSHCRDTGYSGRIAVAEILKLDSELLALIDRGGSPLEITHLAMKKNMYTMKDSALRLLESGMLDMDEFHRVIK